MQSHDQKVEVTAEDVAQLCAINPLAAEQLKNLALQRRLTELEQVLSGGNGGDVRDEVVSRDAKGLEERQ